MHTMKKIMFCFGFPNSCYSTFETTDNVVSAPYPHSQIFLSIMIRCFSVLTTRRLVLDYFRFFQTLCHFILFYTDTCIKTLAVDYQSPFKLLVYLFCSVFWTLVLQLPLVLQYFFINRHSCFCLELLWVICHQLS